MQPLRRRAMEAAAANASANATTSTPPALTHQNSSKSLHSLRSNRSTHSARSIRSIRSNRSAMSVRVFKHDHLSYKTIFGFLHVKHAACLVGLMVLVVVCLSLVYCMFSSQEQNRPHMKLFAVPGIGILIALLYMYVGIIKMKATLLFPFIAVQIAGVFTTVVASIMIAICVVCNTHYVLRHIVDVEGQPKQLYLRQALVTASLLMAFLMLQLWSLRAVCGCYRYFTDLNRFNVRQLNFN